ncbi:MULTISPECIES: DEAD/DEAH box helicase family protein [unclassified Fusibacter]|uniref:TOTE conflict system archaeo-eukaryotic primase domain-containing protein n=1 Tax=unclassified Fusibacter TaxID=2624464 RepID=UPI0013E972F1|nr:MULTISPECIES: DEAD/DEAH box helicase family protein [unclassified Fusibacter]MCK8058429.1 DEAD/DEAH box helicase family protein [Fusibacter sp. A2]NPE22803.1 DEAD/DEAH box helicase family protein [Fusibacter sp. A1]
MKEELQQLRVKLVLEKPEAYSIDIDYLPKEDILEQPDKFITQSSSSKEKIELFQSLFKGRTDVCAKRWKNKPGYSPYCYNDFKPGICNKPKIKCSECKSSHFAPLNEDQLKNHLLGKYVLGLYPMTTKDTCFLLAMDFDESTWGEDIKVVMNVCHGNNIPVYAERSRSGDGCHLWFFFEGEIKASLARKFGTHLLNLAMQECGNIKFDSYDRLFPSQDFLQKEGFGNLIALPLQKEARELCNSEFIDMNLNVISDQWRYLSQIKRISEEFVTGFCKRIREIETSNDNKIIDKVKNTLSVNKSDFPETVILHRSKGILISKEGLSPKALFSIRRLASYANPEFYSKQAMRQSTFGTPRITAIYDEDSDSINLPRGVESNLVDSLSSAEVKYTLVNERNDGREIKVVFKGQLTDHQSEAFEELSKHQDGVLSATTGFGKTVIGAKLIAEKPRKNSSIIGQLGGGKKTIHGIVDIAIMQSMFEKDKSVKQMINQYGLILVDECHHISATNFSRILSAADAKYVYGLTATPIRKDGHHPIIFMHLGPIRYKVDAKLEAKKRDFDHYIVPRFTSTRMPLFKILDEWHITQVYKHICESKYRNELIVTDVARVIDEGRNPLVLTERTSHIDQLVNLMSEKDFEVIVLSGNLKTSDRKESIRRIRALKDEDRFVIVATGKLIGEGFDEARLDTLFMAMPIAWKGTIAQYAGRLHRNFEGKEEVLIYDYVDVHIPVLERMYHKRLTAYRSVGYSIRSNNTDHNMENGIYDDTNYFEHVINDISSAEKNMLISSPFLSKRKINAIKELLIEKYRNSIRIVLCIKALDEYAEKHRTYISEFVGVIEKGGIQVIQLPKNRYKFMIVDNKTVWYGGIDILGGSYNENSLIRIEDEELANELVGAITESALE